jgi:superfamily II RNA helicase
MSNKDNKGNWEYNFFQKIHNDKNQSNLNKEASIKVALRLDNTFNPKNINKYISPEIPKEQQLIIKKKNKETLKANETIILNNYLNKQKILLENDKMMIEKYSLAAKPETSEGKIRLLLHTLDYQIKNNNNDFIANIYLRLLEPQFILSNELKNEYKTLLYKMNQIVNKMDLIELQFNKFHTQMPPLNQKGFNKLDDWQIKVINNIDNNISTVISAPTSAGKSVISGYVTTKGKSLFIVPTDALAWQLSAYIGNIVGTNIPILTQTYQTCPTRDDMIDILNNSQSIVGTADTIIDFLPFIKNDFKWVIYDEIHMIGKDEGKTMEYIAKVLNVPFMALSATIGNIDILVNWFSRIHNRTIDKIVCDKKFFNMQKYHFQNNKLEIIHPLSLITTNMIEDKTILTKTLEPTPPDVFQLVIKLMDVFDMKELSPYVYFKKTERIELDKVNYYFKHLIEFIVNKYKTNKIEITNIINYFKKTYSESKFNYVDLLFKLKSDSKLPAIVFQDDTHNCLELVKEFAHNIDRMETEKYPRLLADRLKQSKMVKKQEKQNDKVKLDTMMENKAMKQMLSNNIVEIMPVSLQEPHMDFILNTIQPFNQTQVEEWVTTLKQYFPIINDTYHYIIKLLWRGVGVYCSGLPDPYLRLVQSLATKKQLSVVFSDKSLVFGISMPFRSVVISKYKDSDLDSMLYHQMAGRAGRRGLDKEGNIIFAGYSWDKIKELSTSQLPNISGINNNMYSIPHANLLSEITKTNYEWNNLTKNYLSPINSNDFYNDIESNYKYSWKFALNNDTNHLHMMWKLRHNPDSIVLSYLFPHIRRYFETKNYIHETNQIDIANFLCNFICIVVTDKKELVLQTSQYNHIKEELNELQLDIKDNIDMRLFVSIQQNTLYNNDVKLRKQLMDFGNTVKNLQHYCFHSNIVGLTKLLGKLLTRIWWIYHMSSPILS